MNRVLFSTFFIGFEKMRVFKLNSRAKDYHQGTILTIGNFDGVHLGHQGLILHAKSLAESKELASMVMLFEPQAKEYFKPYDCPARLSSLREKIYRLKALGVDYVVCVGFDALLANTLAEKFFESLIVKSCHAQQVIIGPDFYFGKGRGGSPQAMQELGVNYQVPVEIYPFYEADNLRVSSTRIREALQENDFNKAQELLGRPYSMLGKVVYGQQLGRQLGVPTANIMISRYKTALHGVFCVKITVCHSKSVWMGVANLGKRPSVDGQRWVLEAHLFDFQGLLYGDFIQVEFLHKIRNEQSFASLDALKQQIHLDIQSAKLFFEH